MTARFSVAYCSQCGGQFGPGDEGFSHCSDHARKCDQLGVCQDRTPPCKDCHPVSEGTRTSRLLLDNMPAAERPPFYIFPRTLEEAFGPGRRDLDVGTEPMHPTDGLVVKVSGLGLAALLVMAVTGVLQ